MDRTDNNTSSHKWRVLLTTCSEPRRKRSDQFSIPNVKDFTFSMSAKMTSAKKLEIQVLKAYYQPAKATVKIDILGGCSTVIDTNNWLSICYFNNLLPPAPTSYNKSMYDISITCQIKWYGFTKDLKALLESTNPPESLEPFLATPEFADVVIIIGNTKLKAHKIILAAQSPVFLAKFRSNAMTENLIDVVNIDDVGVWVMKEILQYLYTGKTCIETNFSLALKMYYAAYKYEIEKLKNLCELTLIANLKIDNAFIILNAAYRCYSINLQEQIINFMIDNGEDIILQEAFKEACLNNPIIMFEVTKRIIGKKK